MPAFDITEVVKMLASLDEPLSVAVEVGALASARLVPPKSLGIDLFLCALYRRYSKILFQYYNDEKAFEALSSVLWPNETRENSASTRGIGETAENAYDTAVGFHVALDSDLERILLNAARISFAQSRPKTSIDDLAASMSTEVRVCESLKAKWGIELKGRTGGPADKS